MLRSEPEIFCFSLIFSFNSSALIHLATEPHPHILKPICSDSSCLSYQYCKKILGTSGCLSQLSYHAWHCSHVISLHYKQTRCSHARVGVSVYSLLLQPTSQRGRQKPNKLCSRSFEGKRKHSFWSHISFQKELPLLFFARLFWEQNLCSR